MLIFSMSASVDGFVNDRDGGIDWTAPDDELFACHLERVSSLGGYLLGRRLYESMIVWETDASLRSSPMFAEFADVWTALPKVVFSRTLTSVRGNARVTTEPVADEIERMLASTDRPVEIGGASLAAQALALGVIDDIRLFRHPVIVGAGTPFLPPVDRTLKLDLVESRAFANGVLYEHYRVPAASPTGA